MNIPDLKSPSQLNEIDKNNNNNNFSGTLVYILIGVIICLLLIIISLHVMPDYSYTTVPETLNKKNIDLEKKEIKSEIVNQTFNEAIEIDWMLIKADAEKNKMPVWSNEKYHSAVLLADEGQALKNKKNYKLSEESYHLAIKELRKTLDNKDNIFQELLSQGAKNLEKEELNKAERIYLKAQSIDEINNTIIRALERIKNRAIVDELYQRAVDYEKKLVIDKAIESINKAIDIEPEYLKIQDQLNHLLSIKKNNDFNIAIDNALKALDKNKFGRAKKEINYAKTMDRNNAIISDLEIRLNVKKQDQKINTLTLIAGEYESNEQWKLAKNNYKKILNIVPNINSVLVKKERTNAYIKLNTLIDAIILKPERLQNEKILKQSEISLKFIQSELNQNKSNYFNKTKTPKLFKKIILAEELLKNSHTIIRLTIKSDNKTDIAIYKVSKLGKLLEKNINIRPGNYTIVGSRKGYRDYRKKLTIHSTDESITINVQCKEKI